MARRIFDTGRSVVGRAGSWRRRWAVAMCVALALSGGMVMLQAVHDTGAFQLDGDAATGTNLLGTPTATDDWDKVCHAVVGSDCGTTSNPTNAKAVAWSADNIIGDGYSTNATTFTGGGSKDPSDLSSWAWKDGSGGLPDKDNLVHAFAVRYSLPNTATCPSGGAPTCDVLFFGSDRFDNSGDAQQGFWFFQNPVDVSYDTDNDGVPDTACMQKLSGGTGFCDPTTGLAAKHRDGDLLIISDFSNGDATTSPCP